MICGHSYVLRRGLFSGEELQYRIVRNAKCCRSGPRVDLKRFLLEELHVVLGVFDFHVPLGVWNIECPANFSIIAQPS